MLKNPGAVQCWGRQRQCHKEPCFPRVTQSSHGSQTGWVSRKPRHDWVLISRPESMEEAKTANPLLLSLRGRQLILCYTLCVGLGA